MAATVKLRLEGLLFKDIAARQGIGREAAAARIAKARRMAPSLEALLPKSHVMRPEEVRRREKQAARDRKHALAVREGVVVKEWLERYRENGKEKAA